MAGMTEEQKKKLMEIELAEKEAVGKGAPPMSAGQKAAVLMYGTIPITADKPDKPEGMSIDIPEGPQVKPKTRELPTMDD
jgi:hypothetical protein